MQEQKYIPALRFDWLTKLYDPLIRNFMPEKEFKKALIDQATLRDNYSVLDFGCGTLTLSIMAKQMHPAITIKGVDVDEKIIAIAERKRKEASLDIDILKYDGVHLPFNNGSFDRIITSLVLHHLTKAQKLNIFLEMKRILKPGGELHIADWGKPAGFLQRLAFYPVQWLDGFETTNDSVYERLPEYLMQSGFQKVTQTRHFKTIIGTVRLYSVKE